jgi:hypothetical protein
MREVIQYTIFEYVALNLVTPYGISTTSTGLARTSMEREGGGDHL